MGTSRLVGGYALATAAALSLGVTSACKRDPNASEADGSAPVASPAALAAPGASLPSAVGPDRSPSPVPLASTEAPPLRPRPSPRSLGGAVVTADACEIEGASFHARAGDEVLRAIARAEDRLYLLDGRGRVHAFVIAPAGGCRLTVDAGFGEGGVLALEQPIRALSAAGGVLLASAGPTLSARIAAGKIRDRCAAPDQGALALHPSGRYAIGAVVGAAGEIPATLEGAAGGRIKLMKVTFADGGCRSERWPIHTQGGFQGVTAVGYDGGTLLVGGAQAWRVEKREPVVIVAMGEDGSEIYRLGRLQPGTGDESFGLLRGVERCAAGICALDAGLSRLSAWKNGEHVGNVPLAALLGLPSPAAIGFALTPGGASYLAATQEQEGEAVGVVFRIRGL